MASLLVSDKAACQNYIGRFMKDAQGGKPDAQVVAALCLGEIGNRTDLSSVNGIIDTLQKMFNAADDEVRQAASFSIGNVSVGNLKFFLPVVMKLIAQNTNYLILTSVREIVLYHAKDLGNFLDKLMPLFLNHCKHEEENIRNISAECIGKLFIKHSEAMFNDVEAGFKSPNPLVRQTIAKSIKYAAVKETDTMMMEMLMGPIIDGLQDKEPHVRKNTLISLSSIAFNCNILRNDIDKIIGILYKETTVKPELITEVDLGPFKHKVDQGQPLRTNAFLILDTLLERIPDKLDMHATFEVLLKGLEDPVDECLQQCQQTLVRLINIAPGAVMVGIDGMVESLDKCFQKNLKMIAGNQETERAMNNCRQPAIVARRAR